MWVPAVLHGIAFALSLGIANLASPLSNIWLVFFLAGCAALLKNGYSCHERLWQLNLLWLIAIVANCFIIMPMQGGAAFMWALAAMPILALCMKREYFKAYIITFGMILVVYALTLITQFFLNVHQPIPYDYSWFDSVHPCASWPMIDPNNAAAVMNAALISCFFLSFSRPWLWGLTIVFALALVLTGSKAGIASALIILTLVSLSRYGLKWWNCVIVAMAAGLLFIPWLQHALISSLGVRKQVWAASARLLQLRPLRGLGIGTFPFYYAQVRTEYYTAGFWAHNDLLQIVLEMGAPPLLAFVILWIEALKNICRRNFPAICVAGVILLQSMVEFQIYVPAISMLLGLSIAFVEPSSTRRLT